MDTDPTPDSELRVTAPHRELLDQVLDKWSLSVLNELCERPSRFNELRRAIPAVTQKSLTATLRRLERNGIIERELLSSRPVAVEYRITPSARHSVARSTYCWTGPRPICPRSNARAGPSTPSESAVGGPKSFARFAR